MQPMDTTVTDHLLSTTRAIRKRMDLDRPVEREVLLECLALAMQAPTGGNRQGWRWVVVTDPDKRRALAEVYRRRSGILEKSLLACEKRGDEQGARVYRSALYLNEILDRVPVHVIPCIEGRVDGATNAAAAGHYGSILPAVWSFMLALRSRGLGSVWTTLHLFDEAETAQLLGIPENFTQVALIPVGYITGDELKPAKRPPAEQFTYWDAWGVS